MIPRNTLFSQQIKLLKDEIKNFYLAGTTIKEIGEQFKISNRNVYHHLGALSADDKGLHAKNLDLRLKQKKEAKAYAKQQAEDSQSSGDKNTTGLDDFE